MWTATVDFSRGKCFFHSRGKHLILAQTQLCESKMSEIILIYNLQAYQICLHARMNEKQKNISKHLFLFDHHLYYSFCF